MVLARWVFTGAMTGERSGPLMRVEKVARWYPRSARRGDM